jgi:integrase/recombinase XerD
MSQLAALDDDDRLIAMWLHGRPDSTRREYARDVAKFRSIVVKPLRETNLEDLQHYQNYLLLRDLKPATLRRKLNTIKSLYSFAASLNYLPFNIAAALRLPKAKAVSAQRFLRPDEVKRLIAAAPPGKARSLLLFLYGTGVRINEACTLRWRDCWQRLDGSTQATITGKGDKQRVILIPPQVWAEVAALAPHPPQPDALVFNLDRRKPKVTVKESPIEGEAKFKSYAGSEYQERERVYDVPYATQEELDLAAQRLGKLLIGRNQGQQIGFALDDYWLSDPPPLQTIAVTEPDGSKQKYLLDTLTISLDARTATWEQTASGSGSLKTSVMSSTGETVEVLDLPYRQEFSMTSRSDGRAEILLSPYSLVPQTHELLSRSDGRAEFSTLEMTGGDDGRGTFTIIPTAG